MKICISVSQDLTVYDACQSNPCGLNAKCYNGKCVCNPDYFGDPYYQCRPECTTSVDCSSNKACRNLKCVDPCVGACASTAVCNVYNHVVMCACPHGTTGSAYVQCNPVAGTRSCQLKEILQMRSWFPSYVQFIPVGIIAFEENFSQG